MLMRKELHALASINSDIFLLSTVGIILLMILLLWEKNLNTKIQKCSQMLVLICHCGGTCLIWILHSNKSKYSKYPKMLAHCFVFL
jgi:hypothetical protein